MKSQLSELIAKYDLEPHRQFLLDIARPTVEMMIGDNPIEFGCSKFGGAPDLPLDFKWPEHKLGLYRFIGQVNLAEIPLGPHALPDDGLLSFFYADDEDGESFWGDPDYVKAYRFDKIDLLRPVEPPSPVRRGATQSIKFELGVDLPAHPWWNSSAMAKWPIDDDESDAYWDLRCELHPSNRYLMGYSFNTTLAYDPSPGREWRSLLTLSSDDDLEWCWHDGDWLVTFIEEQRLAAGDFSQIKSDAG